MAISVAQLQRAASIGSGGDVSGSLPAPRDIRAGSPGEFGDLLKNALGKVDDAQKGADAQMSAFVAGEQENLHEVMISMNHAQLTFQMATEVRNRLLETYQELMRMQV
jgi:flagellar hook-basal body complex protein FliE